MGLGSAMGNMINIATRFLNELFPSNVLSVFALAFTIIVAVAVRRSLIG